MVQELDRALGMGAAGVGIATNVGDLELQAPELRNFWQEMHRRKLMVLVHPTCPCDGPQNDPRDFSLCGLPGRNRDGSHEARSLRSHSGVPRCEDRLVAPGRGLADDLDRIDRGYQRFSICPHPPSTYLRRCYFDTACTHGPALECARSTWGVDRLVFGTDVPHVPNAEKETIAALKARSWAESELEGVLGGTVGKLLAGCINTL